MQLLRSHGITREVDELKNKKEGPWYYEQQLLGFNYRMTDIQAALGLSQLGNLESWIVKRQSIADQYDQMLADLPVVLPKRMRDSRSSLHLYPVQLANRQGVFNALREAGIGVNVHYIPVHFQPDFQGENCVTQHTSLRIAEEYYTRCISLPLYPSLGEEEQRKIIRELKDALL